MRKEPVETKTGKGKSEKRYFYFDIIGAVESPMSESAVRIINADLRETKNFGREIVLDLSSDALEFANCMFPVNRIFDPDAWFNGFMEHWNYEREKIKAFQAFQNTIVNSFKAYKIPAIRLTQETTREAVCLVFEKVNTGGKKLDTFELLTASFAATGRVDLRRSWYGDRHTGDQGIAALLAQHDVLKDVERTAFLQAIALAHTYEQRQIARTAGRAGKDLPMVSCQRGAVLGMPVGAFERWHQKISKGFQDAARFLHARGIYWWKDIPYPTQTTALAALFAIRDLRPLTDAERSKLCRWYWCGVFGELYGSATEIRLANDVEDLMDWFAGGDTEPRTIRDAHFQESRLNILYSRISAAYKGVHALVLSGGAVDLLTGESISVANYFAESFDIHHIFPQAWCRSKGIKPNDYDSIINKTAISARTNRIIGGSAPSLYVRKLEEKGQILPSRMDAYLAGHLIDPALLRKDDFAGFHRTRRAKLVDRIEAEMGKPALRDGSAGSEDYQPSEDETELLAEVAE